MGEPAVKAAAVQKPGWSDELVRDVQARLDKRRREQAVAADDKGKGKKSKGKGDKDVADVKQRKPVAKSKPAKPGRDGIRFGLKRDADSMAADDKGMGKGNKSKSSHDEDVTEVTTEDMRRCGIIVEEDSKHDQDEDEIPAADPAVKCAHPHCLKFENPEQVHGFCCKPCCDRFGSYPYTKAKWQGIHGTGPTQTPPRF